MAAIVTSPAVANNVSLSQARNACADAIVRGYGATRNYAKEMLCTFGMDWHTQEESKEVKAEKAEFYAALKAGGHTNPSVVWARVKKEAAKVVAEAEKANAPEGEEGEAESTGGAKHTRSVQLRFVEELTALYKLGKREAGSLTDGQKRAHALVAGALAELGVDIAQL